MIKIIDYAVVEAIPFIALILYSLYIAEEIPIHIYFFAIFMIMGWVFIIFRRYSFNEEYIEQSIFGKKKRLPLKNIDSIRTTFFRGVFIIESKYPKRYYWMLTFTFQKKKRKLFFEYIKKVNPHCKIFF